MFIGGRLGKEKGREWDSGIGFRSWVQSPTLHLHILGPEGVRKDPGSSELRLRDTCCLSLSSSHRKRVSSILSGTGLYGNGDLFYSCEIILLSHLRYLVLFSHPVSTQTKILKISIGIIYYLGLCLWLNNQCPLTTLVFLMQKQCVGSLP